MSNNTMSKLMRYASLSGLLCIILFVKPLFAMVTTVTGNIISWPNDAWYQVQNAQTFEIVCAGGSQCEVPDGAYNVQWFDFDGSGGGGQRVVVGSPVDETLNNESFKGMLSTDDNTITWTVAGWYQVQDANTYDTICNGDDQCVVEPGRYIVINHSLGLRAEVNVSSGGDGVFPNGITLIGDILAWPNDGWYQVQNAQTYAAICNGGTECQVVPGSYIVINHSLGVRSNIDVPGDVPDTREVPRPDVIKLLGYSCTQEEFFFEEPAAAENIVSIEVMRNGVVIGTTEANTFFTDDRPLGTAQRYDFIAIRSDGARSGNSFYATRSRC